MEESHEILERAAVKKVVEKENHFKEMREQSEEEAAKEQKKAVAQYKAALIAKVSYTHAHTHTITHTHTYTHPYTHTHAQHWGAQPRTVAARPPTGSDQSKGGNILKKLICVLELCIENFVV